MNKDISIVIGNVKVNYRVAAWIMCEDKVLLAKDLHPNPSDDFYNMPGGRVSAGESAKDAIIRELKEELNVTLDSAEPIKIMENFFSYNNNNYHEILFIFKFNILKSNDISKQGEFASLDNKRVVFKWFKLDEIKNIICKPQVIYKLAKVREHKFDYEIGN